MFPRGPFVQGRYRDEKELSFLDDVDGDFVVHNRGSR